MRGEKTCGKRVKRGRREEKRREEKRREEKRREEGEEEQRREEEEPFLFSIKYAIHNRHRTATRTIAKQEKQQIATNTYCT